MAVLISDDFNRAGPGLGANWSADAASAIISNQARVGSSAFATGYAIHLTSPGTANYTVSAKITQAELASSGGVGLGIVARLVDTSNFYLAWIDENGANYRLYAVTGGAYNQIGTSPYTPPAALSDPVTLLLSVNGTAIKVFVNGVERITATNGALTAVGLTGLRAFNMPSTPGHRFDDFTVEDIPAAPVTTIQARTPVGVAPASGAGFTMPVPSGTADGDFLVAVIATALTTTPSAPTDWTKSSVATAGTAHAVSVYTARYSAGLSRSFTNVAALGAAVCNAFYFPGRIVELDGTPLAATSSTSSTAMPTGAPTTGPVAGDFEALAYGWTGNVTLGAGVSGSQIDLSQANGTSLRSALGRNTNDSLPASTAVTAFSQTLSGSSTRKAGFGVLLRAVVYKDLSGSSAGRSIASGVITGPVLPQPTQALLIDEHTEAVAVNWTLGTTQPLTMAFWCKLTEPPSGHGNVATIANAGFNSEVGFWIPDFRPRIFQGSVMISLAQTDVLSPMVDYDDWHHVVFSRDNPSGIFRGYLDGVPFPSEAGTTPSPNGPLADAVYLVVGAGGPSHFVHAAISQFRVWLARLSAAEILAEMNSPVAVRSLDLYGDWKFDGALTDATPNARHMAGIGMPTTGAVTYTTGPTSFRDLAGSAAGSSTVGVTLSRLKPLLGSSAGTSVTVGALRRTRALVGGALGQSIASAAPTRRRALTAASTGTSTTTAVASRKRALVAASAGHAVTTGQIDIKGSVFRPLVGAAAGRSITTAVPTRSRRLQAAAVGTSSASATISKASVVTAGVGWDGSQFQSGSGTAVLWGMDAFQTAGGYPAVVWEDDHFEES